MDGTAERHWSCFSHPLVKDFVFHMQIVRMDSCLVYVNIYCSFNWKSSFNEAETNYTPKYAHFTAKYFLDLEIIGLSEKE